MAERDFDKSRIRFIYGANESIPCSTSLRLSEFNESVRDQLIFSQIAHSTGYSKELRFIQSKTGEIIQMMEPDDIIAARRSVPYLNSVLQNVDQADLLYVKHPPVKELVLQSLMPRVALRIIGTARKSGDIGITTLKFPEGEDPVMHTYSPDVISQLDSGKELKDDLITHADLVVVRQFPSFEK